MKVSYTTAQKKIKNELIRRHRGQEFVDYGKLR